MERLQTIQAADAAERQIVATQIVESLPDGPYNDHYIPTFPDQDAHIAAVQELLSTQPATSPESVLSLVASFEDIVLNGTRAVVIDHNCAEPVSLETDLEKTARDILSNMEDSTSKLRGDAEASAIPDVPLLRIKRGRGQNTKPRTDEEETVEIDTKDGKMTVTRPTYKGDAVHSLKNLTHDPARMVGAADQAFALNVELTRQHGVHVPAAHEALLLQYEAAFTRTDPRTGRKFLLSADLPWVGLRTNDPYGPHVQALKGIENAVGVKLGVDTSREHLRALVEELNPERRPGKLVLMPRFGKDNLAAHQAFAELVAEETEEALLVADVVHGNTRKRQDGSKTRLVSDIITETEVASAALRSVGLRLHGVHLETIADDSRKECVDHLSEEADKSIVDPQLNRTQTLHVLRTIAPHFL